MTHSSTRWPAAALLGSTLLLPHLAFADDACCKDSCCDKKPEAGAFQGITGDWGGLRKTLQEKGFDFAGFYTGEIFGNPKGGRKQDVVLNGLLKLNLDVNLEKAAGWPAASFRLSTLTPHGTSGTDRNVGDAARFSNLDAPDTFRLVDFWIEQRFSEDKVSLKLGQMRIDDEFGVTDTAGLFINSSFGVPNPALTPMPLPTYPVGALGVRLKVEPIKGLYGEFGIYDGNPCARDFTDPTDNKFGHPSRHGLDWSLRRSEGTLYIGEVGYARTEGAYPGAYRLGYMKHTDDYLYVNSANRNSASPSARNSSHSSYFVIDQTIWQKPNAPKEGVSAFLRGTFAPEDTSYMSRTTQFGVVYTGLASAEDKLGVAYAYDKFSPNQQDAGYSKDREAITEISYQFPVTSYLRVQPDLQYISHPGGTSQYNNAWVIGIRATVDF